MIKLNFQKGFMALLAVITIASVLLLWSRSSVFAGLSQLNLSSVANKSEEARVLADACLEEALGRLRLDLTYGIPAPPALSLPDGSCIISVSNAGAGKKVVASATVGEYQRQVSASLTVVANVVTVTTYSELGT